MVKKKRRFLKVLIWFFVVIIILIGAGAAAIFRIIPITNFVSALESNVEGGAPQFLRNIASKNEIVRDYSTLPEILKFNNGDSVESTEDYQQRQDEMIELLKENIYGDVPDIDYEVSFKTLKEDDNALDGNAIRKQIEITVSTEYGENKSVLLIYIPKSDEKVPVFVGLNFKGNTTVISDENVIPSYGRILEDGTIAEEPGQRASKWEIEYVVEQGYALATICADDFAPDNKDTYSSRLISIFGGDNEDMEFKAISAWAFGLSRAIDYLVEDDLIDSDRIISVGHSRMGKTSLWAGALDERIALVISNGSGSTGASLARSSIGETVKSINTLFPYWFADKYSEYSKNVEGMPVDQHMLLASIYPRKVYVASSTRDLWADPFNEFMSLKFATEALSSFGVEAIVGDELPDAGTTIFTEYYGYHIKEDNHQIKLEDWKHFIDYADEFLD